MATTITRSCAAAPGIRLKPPPPPLTLILKPPPRRPLPPRLALPGCGNPDPGPSSSASSSLLSPSLSSSSRGGCPGRGSARCAAEASSGGVVQGEGADYEHQRVVHQRPACIPWRKDLVNTVYLIGVVGTLVKIKYASNGKVLAWTRLGVKTSPTDTTWFNLTLWDDLAHVAFQHVQKGQQIYVHGQLVADSVKGDDNERQIYYKVEVHQLNFVEKNFSRASLYDPESGSLTKAGGKAGNYMGSERSSLEELWQAFFANPMDWWDNRKKKKNPKFPDFKHKHTGEGLWIGGRCNPPWVKSQLSRLDSRMSYLQANDTDPSLSFMPGGEFTHF